MGVRKAVQLALKAAWEVRLEAKPNAGAAGTRRLWTMGPLIHNARVTQKLQEHGFSVLDEAGIMEPSTQPDLNGAVVVVRAHGIGPQIEEALHRCGAQVVDATCPKVKENQEKVRELSEKGYLILIAGEKNHDEVRGICAYAQKSMVLANRMDVEPVAEAVFKDQPFAKAALLAQTTLSKEEFDGIASELLNFFPDLAIFNTICPATASRQEALSDLCSVVDAVIVAGDSASANTRRLAMVAEKHGKPAYLVENSMDIPPFINKYRVIGLAAGASTPDDIIEEIAACLETK
ncbi:4-hydroxy-3-methylbut-2-enyl diphosphate reductase [Spirochaetia bacterium]|nr:4-hydroxy-3-methylbut-2-enyl diphosphate reductase [Spirochaetia bacterium]